MSLLPEKYDRYYRILKFVLKYWNSDLFIIEENDSLSIPSKTVGEHLLDPTPEELVEDLKELGPTYVKLGQLLSTRPDLLPEPYLNALVELQDQVEFIPFEEVQQIFMEQTGRTSDQLYAHFEEMPIASASIGQVHLARLFTGEEVAVKVQRPNMDRQFAEDLDALMTLSEKAEEYIESARKFSIHDIVEEMKHILMQELDYEREAQNLELLKKHMKEFKSLKIPKVYIDYTTPKILTMEFIKGQKVTDFPKAQLHHLPKKEMVDDLIKGYLKQIIVDGFAHADPHPGNVHVTNDHQLALLDLGMVAQFSKYFQNKILLFMIALSDGDGDQVCNVLMEISEYEEEEFNESEFRKVVSRKIQDAKHSKAKDLRTGRDILEINQLSAHMGLRLPTELTVLGKILLNMDQIIAYLSPEHEMQKTVKDYVEHLMKLRTAKEMKSGSFFETLLESQELAKNIPHRLNKITENLASNKFKVQLDAIDENKFLYAFQKVANRISISLIIAALILGAAVIMRIPTSNSLWGYPPLAIILFLVATFIGLFLVYQIMFKDEKEPKK